MEHTTVLSSMAEGVAAELIARNETIAVSESSTGGLVSAALLAIPGASAYYRGGAVIYTGAARSSLLAIPALLPQAIRSASQPYAALCAGVIRDRLGAVWGLAETGAAGPSGNNYGDAAGHCCIAVMGPVQSVITLATESNQREENMWTFARAALDELLRSIRAA